MLTVDFERLNLPAGCRILDVGCGSGRHTAAAYRLPAAVAVGVDPSWKSLCEARDRLQLHQRLGAHAGGRWSLCTANGLDLPFADGCFDAVICAEVLEHVREDHRALAESTRVLRPGGDLVVSVPRFAPERICWALSTDYAAAEGGHIRIYRKKELLALLRRSGLAIRACRYAHSLHSPYWWLKCALGPQRPETGLVKLYHRLLTWELMRHPPALRFLDRLLNPLLGKSLVVYCRKPISSG
jgi:SAM-dependent methyltransferase